MSPSLPAGLSAQDSEFLFEATGHLCSSLVPETVFPLFFRCLAQRLPIREFLLGSLRPPFQEMCLIASISASKNECPFAMLPLSPEQSALGNSLDITNPDKFHSRLIVSQNDPFFRYLKMFRRSSTSLPLFFLRLVRENAVLGAAVFVGSRLFPSGNSSS